MPGLPQEQGVFSCCVGFFVVEGVSLCFGFVLCCVWFVGFFGHTLWAAVIKVIPWTQSACFKHPISPLVWQGGLYIFHEASNYASGGKKIYIAMATDPSHAVEWLIQLS